MATLAHPDASTDAIVRSMSRPTFSVDGEYFVIVVRKPNVESGKNDFDLQVYSTSEVLSYVNAAENGDKNTSSLKSVEDVAHSSKAKDVGVRRPKPFFSATFSSGSNSGAVNNLRWLADNRTLAFLGEDDPELGPQVYTLDIRSKKLERMTSHPERIVAFELHSNGTLLYTARKPLNKASHSSESDDKKIKSAPDKRKSTPADRVDAENLNAQYFIVDKKGVSITSARDLNELHKPKRPIPYRHHYYVQRPGKPAKALPLEFSVAERLWYDDVYFSPSGNKIIATRELLRNELQESWPEEYPNFGDYWNVTYSSRKGSDELTSIFQYVVVDLDSGEERPLFGSPVPSGYLLGGYKFGVHWLDDQTVIVANTFLPLDVKDPQVLENRRQVPATVEYHLDSKKITTVMEHRLDGDLSKGFSYLGVSSEGIVSIESGRKVNHYQKIEGQWKAFSNEVMPEQRLMVEVAEDLNVPPNLLARDAVTGNERIVTDLNPQFRELSFGETEVYRWKDKNEIEWEAGIVYPPNYKAGKRYPLVIQTHGFDKHQFLIEGPGMIGGYAAQALVNRDLIVVQVPDKPVPPYFSRMVLQSGIEALIDQMDEDGLILRNKVGLQGFSATGHEVQHIVTFSDYDFAAANIVDAFNMTLWGYSSFYGLQLGGMAYIEPFYNAQPWGEGLESWVSQDPSMHLDRVKTPIRMQQHNTGQVMHWFDVYAMLRRQEKPVEMVMLMAAPHNLVKPWERLAMQEQNVDWFSFWLTGYEDPNPAKAEQYKRWRKFKEQQKSSEVAATAARERDKQLAEEKAAFAAWREKQKTSGKAQAQSSSVK
ncbi:hypothetical protein QP938_09950 [Porticoccaceae bacterium LTM1]|nr:hypothetical protein QP938_09950 [Porticoccaceae bacterium LTM1]